MARAEVVVSRVAIRGSIRKALAAPLAVVMNAPEKTSAVSGRAEGLTRRQIDANNLRGLERQWGQQRP
jgi:hypothetical protein